MTRRTRLAVTQLEERATPVIGGFDVPYVSDPDAALGTTNLSGIVDYNGVGTGTLVDRGTNVTGSRHVLTAASLNPKVGDVVTFYTRQTDGTIKPISIPVIDVFVPPGGGDIAMVTLAAVAPAGIKDYPLYTSVQASQFPEVGQPFTLAGFGRTGDGTSGQADLDLQRMRIVGTGGSFFLVLNGVTGTTALRYNATAAQVQAALNTDFGANATVVTQPTVGPFTSSYEVLFTAPVVNNRRLGFVSNPVDPFVNGPGLGQVNFVTLTDGQFNVEFQRLAVNATAGTFRLGIGGPTPTFTPAIPYNATPAQIEAALLTLPGITDVTVTAVTSGPAAGTFQIAFDQSTPVNLPQLVVDTTQLTGTARVTTIQDGGAPAIRVGQGVYEAQVGNNLTDRFANDGTRAFYSPAGDVGAPGLFDVGGGVFDITSVFSSGGGKFGATQTNTRVAPFSNSLRTYTDTFPYTLTVDMQYQLTGNDGTPDTLRIRRNGSQVQVFTNDLNGNPVLLYADDVSKISSLVVNGTADDDTFIVEGNIGIAVFVDGKGGNDTLAGANVASRWTIDGPNKGFVDSINTFFTNVENLRGGSADDTFNFQGPGRISGDVDGGGGFELLDFSGSASTDVTLTGVGPVDGINGTVAGGIPIGGQFLNINAVRGSQAGTSDSLTGFDSAGTWTVDVPNGVYTDSGTGQSIQFGNFEVLNGGPANDTFNIRNTSGPLTINAGDGDDVFNIAADASANTGNIGSLGGTLLLDGAGGNDRAFVAGTGGDDALMARLTSSNGDGEVRGFAQVISFAGLEAMNFDARGGNNSFAFVDDSNSSYGTPTDPGSGIVFAPSGQNSGSVRVGNLIRFGFTGITNGLTLSGDGDGSGDPDVFLVTGTSADGAGSAFGEATIGDGADRITVDDSRVVISSVSAGPLLSPTFAYFNGNPTFSTLYVGAGNEAGPTGDIVTVTPSNRVNIVVDGMNPTRTPGDKLLVNANGPTSSATVNDPSLGPPQTRITQQNDGASLGFLNFESIPRTTTGTAISSGMVAVGSGAGTEARVQVYDRLSGALRFEVRPYPGFFGGVSVASGDLNGDGIADLVVGAGPGGGPRIAVFNGLDGSYLYDFFGYESEFRGGVNVAVADLNNDGIADIILGTGPGGGPRIRVLDGKTLEPVKDFFGYSAEFRGGVNVATGDFNGDGISDLITSTGAGGGPQLVVRDGNTLKVLASFFVFDPNSRSGFYATAGDVNGDGIADIIVGSGAGTPAEVRVFSGRGRALLTDFSVGDPFTPFQTPNTLADVGVRVASADLNGDGIADIITAKGPGSTPTIRAYAFGAVNPQTNALFTNLREIRRQDVFEPDYGFGIFVGASD